MNSRQYKQQTISLIMKTGNPIAPLQMAQLQLGVESGAKLFAPLCDKEKVKTLQERLMKNFTSDELDFTIGDNSEMVLALLAMLKTSVIAYLPKA